MHWHLYYVMSSSAKMVSQAATQTDTGGVSTVPACVARLPQLLLLLLLLLQLPVILPAACLDLGRYHVPSSSAQGTGTMGPIKCHRRLHRMRCMLGQQPLAYHRAALQELRMACLWRCAVRAIQSVASA
jgi:hypothetical protein